MIFPLKVGITGGIGSGKTIVCKILETMGYPVFFSDRAAKELMHSDQELKKNLIELLGKDAYVDGVLNRTLIAQLVFSNPDLLAEINSIVHPQVRNAYTQFVESNSYADFVFNEAAILFETGAYKSFDSNILVTAEEGLRIQRVMERDQLSAEQVVERMKNQWADKDKVKLADYVILNNSTDLLTPQIERILANLLQKNRRSN